jgi:putative multicomponent Na+:H+ antiporter subunit B
VTASTALLLLLPFVAAFSLTRRRRIVAVIGMGMFSLLLAAVYVLLDAPDVAITEAAIGAALVTSIYILAIRKTGRLVVVGDEAPGLLEREGDRITGLEQEILASFSKYHGLDLVIHFLPRGEIEEALLRGEADIGAGGIVSIDEDDRFLTTREHLPTGFFRLVSEGAAPSPRAQETEWIYFSDVLEAIRAQEKGSYALDLARFIAASRLDLSGYSIERLPGSFSYTFSLPSDREDLHRRLDTHLDRLRESGELDEMIRRHFS